MRTVCELREILEIIDDSWNEIIVLINYSNKSKFGIEAIAITWSYLAI